MPHLEIKDLYFNYDDRPILQGLNFTINKAQLTAIIGANGCGKTTLLKNISGYLKPARGQVFIIPKEEDPGKPPHALKQFRQDVQKLNITTRARNISYVSQELYDEFSFTCFDLVMMGRTPYLKRFQHESVTDQQIARKAMELTGTWPLKDRLITQLSGGEKQRVYIARSLAQQPQILLLDEPLSHLDLKYQMEILALLKNLASKGILILAVLHDINLASQFADEIIIMKEGRIISRGKPAEIIGQKQIQSAFALDVEVLVNPRTKTPYIIPI